MADGTKRSGPRTDASLTRARQRFGPPNCSDARRRNMMIAAVLIVLGMIVIAGATHHAPRTRTPIYERHSVPWAEFRRGLRRRKGFRRTSALKYLYTLEPGTWYLVPGIRVPGTAVYVFGISRRHLFSRPATRTGTFSALGWNRLPSTVALSLCVEHNFAMYLA